MAKDGTNAQVDTTKGDLKTSTAAELHKSQLEEYAKIKKMLKFLRKADEINEPIVLTTKNIVAILPTLIGKDLLIIDVLDIIYYLPPVKSLLPPEFFNRPTLFTNLAPHP